MGCLVVVEGTLPPGPTRAGIRNGVLGVVVERGWAFKLSFNANLRNWR